MEDTKPHDDTLETLGAEVNSGEARAEGEPFPCPHCGQMLAASCRVCVACKAPVEPPRAAVPVAVPQLEPASEAAPPALVRFPWPIFFAVLCGTWLTAIFSLQFLGAQKTQFLLAGIQLGTSAWVLADARARRLPRPWRWGLGSLFLWIMIFPWYLARRREPQATCRFVEAEASPLARVVVIVLLVFILTSLVVGVLKGPANP